MKIGFARVTILLSLIMLTVAISITEQGRCETTGLEKIDKPIKENELNLKKLKSGMKIHLGRLLVMGEQEFNLLDQIERLDQSLALQKIRLDVMIERLNSQEELLVIKKRDLAFAQKEKIKVRQHLEKRLRSFYLMGKTGILNVTFLFPAGNRPHCC